MTDILEWHWPSLISYHIVGNFGCQPLPKKDKNDYHDSTVQETCNNNQMPLNLGQSSTSTCCWPSWMTAITKK